MKKTFLLTALVVLSVLALTACGPKGAATDGNALTTFGNGMVTGGNVATASNAG